MSTSSPDAEQMAVHTLIAVKYLNKAKTRLAADFAVPDRERLVLAMLADTLAAIDPVSEISTVTVITPDAAVAELARNAGAAVFPEPARTDRTDREDFLNIALSHAAADVRREHGPVDLLALQADLPALRPEELAAAISAAPAGRSIVADHRQIGTSALLLRDSSSELMPTFGAGSADRHRATGATALVGHWPGLRLDVDTAGDLRLAVALGVGPATSALLEHLGWS